MVDELKNHLVFEFKHGRTNKTQLLETHGAIDSIDLFITFFIKVVDEQLNTSVGGESVDKVYDFKNLTEDHNISTFFNQCEIELISSFNNKGSYNGVCNPDKNGEFDKDKNFICYPHIVLKVVGPSKYQLQRLIEYGLGHELTHAYNLYQFAVKNGYQFGQSGLKKMKYDKITKAKNSDIHNVKVIADTLYNLNRLERNAYIGQLKKEVEAESEKIVDAQTAWDVVKNTNTYRRFKGIEQFVNSILDNDVTETTKSALIEYLNDVMKTKFTTYNQFKKYFVRRWYKWKSKFLTMASKIVYDVFDKNNTIYLS